MEGLQASAGAALAQAQAPAPAPAPAPASASRAALAAAAPWGEFVEEQVFFVKKVAPGWGVEGVDVAEDGEEEAGEAKPGNEMAVACEAVEFEDLFANPIAEGANLEFRVSRATEGGRGGDGESAAMEVDGTVFERLSKSEIVMEGEEEREVEVEVAVAEGGVKEDEFVESDVKVELSEGEGKLTPSLEGASEEINLEEESDAAVAMSRLEMQSKLVKEHVAELQRIVTLQCRLTGANPLAQELASAILGTKEGKLGSSLSPETLRYLHAVFAIKDTLTKKEARDLGLISGATLTQVRDFFATQRSKVRALVQQFTDEAEARSVEIGDEQPDQSLGKDIGFTKLTDVDSVESLLETMRQENFFTQQEKLLQIILRTEQGLILRRFLEKGGLKVLCAWLIAAAADEQTTLLRQLLHVLSHLPMNCAVPLQVSSLLQPVNKLRFYFVQDVANHARLLMSKWSDLFMNKVEGVTSVDSAGLGTISKDNLDVPRRAQKRERDPTVIMKRYEGGLPKVKTAEPVKGQFNLARASMRPFSSGEGMKIPVLALSATKAAGGHIVKSKFDLKSKTVGKELPNYNTSKLKALAAMRRDFHKTVPSNGEPQPQTSVKPRLSETAVVDEIATNQALGVGARNPLSGPSPSTSLTTSQTPKARGAFSTEEGSKVKGAAKVAAVMSNIRSSSPFPVSEAANFATPVSRKHLLGDQQKERRKVLPVEDLGNGNRWRESTARRPVIEVGKTSRPLSADEIRKAKLRARIMQLPTAGNSGHKSGSTQEPYSSRGKPTPVGDGWSLDRYASMDGGDKPTQDSGGVSLPRPTTSNVDTTFVPKQILDEKTFDQLLAEQAAESKVPGSEQTINTRTSPIHANTLEQGAESTVHLHDVSLPESDSNLNLDTSFQQATSMDVDSQPLSPSIAVALCENSSETVSEVSEDIGVLNAPVNVSSGDAVVDTVAEDSVMEQAPVESGCLDVIPSEPVNDKVIKSCLIPWVVPPVLNLNSAWGVVAGGASKELGFQAARVKREEEEIYSDLLSIPDNPKDLWDEEPLYDDTLTPEIPVEVLEFSSSKASSPTAVVNQVVEYNPLTNGTLPAANIREPHVASTNTYGGAQQIGDAASGHDPNLLALLLSNPHLVSQLASQQKGDGSLAGLSALLALGNVACQSAPTQAREVLSQPANNSNVSVQPQFPHAEQLPAAMQPRDEVANIGNFQGGQPLATPFPETNEEPVRMVEETSGAVAPVPSWDGSSWALPTPPAPSITGSAMSAQGSNQPPPHGSVPQEFVSVGPPAYNGSFQKLPNAPYTWTPLNTLMHTSPKLFDPSLGRGRLPVMSHNVNGASGMPAADVVDDATVSSSGVPPPVFGQVAAPFNSVQSWPPPHGNNANHHQPVNVVNHHNVVAHAANSHSAQGNVNSTWTHSEQAGLPDFQHRRLPETPLWGRPVQIPSSSSLPAPPLPPYPPQPHSHSSNHYWQPQEPPNSFRPAPSSSHLPPFRQDCRPHHPSAPWHPNAPNYGHNQR